MLPPRLSFLVFAHILGLGEWTILYYLKFLLVATAQAFLLVKSLVRCPDSRIQ